MKSAEKKIKIVLFYCQNCVSNDKDINLIATKTEDFTLRAAVLPCSSKIQTHTILKILDKEADGVEVVACPDEKCYFLVGSVRTKRRVEYVRKLLDEIGVGAERVGLIQKTDLSCDDLIELAENRANAIINRNRLRSVELRRDKKNAEKKYQTTSIKLQISGNNQNTNDQNKNMLS